MEKGRGGMGRDYRVHTSKGSAEGKDRGGGDRDGKGKGGEGTSGSGGILLQGLKGG